MTGQIISLLTVGPFWVSDYLDRVQLETRTKAFRCTHVKPDLTQEAIHLQLYVDIVLLYSCVDGVDTNGFHSGIFFLRRIPEIFG